MPTKTAETFTLRPDKEIREMIDAAMAALSEKKRQTFLFAFIREDLPKYVERKLAEREDGRAKALQRFQRAVAKSQAKQTDLSNR
jgi:uncharacterized protein (DUF1778 family)